MLKEYLLILSDLFQIKILNVSVQQCINESGAGREFRMFYRSNENFITWLYASRKLQPSILTDVGSNPRHRLCEDVIPHVG